MAALLWTAVYAALRRTTATHSMAGWIVALAVLNPMVVFLSSGVNPDAVSFPLSTLAILGRVARAAARNASRSRAGVPAGGCAGQAIRGGAVDRSVERDRHPVAGAPVVRRRRPAPIIPGRHSSSSPKPGSWRLGDSICGRRSCSPLSRERTRPLREYVKTRVHADRHHRHRVLGKTGMARLSDRRRLVCRCCICCSRSTLACVDLASAPSAGVRGLHRHRLRGVRGDHAGG